MRATAPREAGVGSGMMSPMAQAVVATDGELLSAEDALSAHPPLAVPMFYGDFSICMVKGNKREKLGLRVGHGEDEPPGRLVVNAVEARGMIQKYNQEHTDPQCQVMVGDHIIGVNDVEGDQMAMIHELKMSQSLEIRLVRLNPEQRDAMRHDAFRSKDKALRSVFDSLPTVYAGALGVSECVVCQVDFDPQQRLTQLPCKHAFCTPCISRWLLECKNECPLCARPITMESVCADATSVDTQQERLQYAASRMYKRHPSRRLRATGQVLRTAEHVCGGAIRAARSLHASRDRDSGDCCSSTNGGQ